MAESELEVRMAMHGMIRGLAIAGFVLAMGLTNVRAQTQQGPVVALKAGESADVGNVFGVVNCRSILKGPMSVEILEAPPGVTVSIREQKIIPRKFNCANPVDGGVLVVTAPKEINERAQSKLVFRVKYVVPDGE